MLEVTLSEKYQILVPHEIRELLHLEAGQKFSIILNDNSITLVPKLSNKSFRGILKGANTDNIRDRDESKARRCRTHYR